MNRKILYIIMVIIIAISVAIFSDGCASKENERNDSSEKKIQEVSENNEKTQDDLSKEDEKSEETPNQTYETGIKKDIGASEGEYVIIVVRADSILKDLERLDESKLEIMPSNGIIIPETKIIIEAGDTVFDVLLKATKDEKIHMEYVSTPLYKSNYIEGIGNIYEMDAGPLSGWMYKVNEWFPNYGCGQYVLQGGDRIEWVYTCDLGRDIGGDWNEQNSN